MQQMGLTQGGHGGDLPAGVLCDGCVPLQLEGQIHKTTGRPTLLYEAQCWETKKQEDEIHVADLCILRSISSSKDQNQE